MHELAWPFTGAAQRREFGTIHGDSTYRRILYIKQVDYAIRAYGDVCHGAERNRECVIRHRP
jgi:hypothetical protein